ncbi:MAG TPA: hypothetical protein VHH73_03985, partial [Verrucomicrobiae bacterium]|nr:hypothetical protein [Verrucomicrobiae bacterium]
QPVLDGLALESQVKLPAGFGGLGFDGGKHTGFAQSSVHRFEATSLLASRRRPMPLPAPSGQKGRHSGEDFISQALIALDRA